jgi:hypothetical protein
MREKGIAIKLLLVILLKILMVETCLNRGLNLLFFLIAAAGGFLIVNGIVSLERSLVNHPLGTIVLGTVALGTIVLGTAALGRS